MTGTEGGTAPTVAITGASTGLTNRNWKGSSAQRGCELAEPPAAMDEKTWSWGQP